MGFDFWLIEETYFVTKNGQKYVISRNTTGAYDSEIVPEEFIGVDCDDPEEYAKAKAAYKARFETPRVIWKRSNPDESLRGLWKKAANNHKINHEDVVEVHVVKSKQPR
mgnify:CR=1 FL=1